MATFTTVGTFTRLRTDLTPMDESVTGGAMYSLSINPIDLSSVPQEIPEIIKNFQAGWGAQIAAGHRVGHWSTAVLLRDMLTAYVNQGVTRSGY